jgi:glycosyltransferase involved in cell wall biosynthesis
MKNKIIIFGDDPTGYTGFGKISDHLVDAISGAGYTPVVVGLKTNKNKNYGKAKIYNTVALSDNQGWETLEKALTLEKAKMVISIGDPWDIQGLADIKQRIPFTWIGYVPVDSIPYPRYILLVQNPQQYLDTAFLLSSMDHIVTYSEFGKNAVRNMLESSFSETPEKSSLPDITRIYLGVDSELYYSKDKKEARKIFDGAVSADTLLFNCIKVNSMRAGFDSLLNAWSIYMTKAKGRDPELARRSKLYLHTNVEGSGYPLPVIMKRYNIENSLLLNPELKPGHGFPETIMTDVVSSSDIAISATRGEGFGLNIIEAMSCKVPCIIPDYGCPSEYGGNAVARVPVAANYNPEFATTDFAIIDVNQMAETMLELALDKKRRERMGREGREIACLMSWEKFIAAWIDLIKAA